MNTVSATTMPGHALRDPRMQWRRAMTPAASGPRATPGGPGGSAAPAGPVPTTEPPTFAERARRVEVRGRDATVPTTEPPTFAERERRVEVRGRDATASTTEPPTFAERGRRVEVRGRDAAAPTTEPPTFAERMRRVAVATPSEGVANAAEDPRGAARASAEQMVASLFIQPMLDAAFEQDTSGPFSPGRAEKTFGPLLNQRLADEIVRKTNLPLVQAIVDRVAPPAAPAAPAAPPADAAATATDASASASTFTAIREPRDG